MFIVFKDNINLTNIYTYVFIISIIPLKTFSITKIIVDVIKKKI